MFDRVSARLGGVVVFIRNGCRRGDCGGALGIGALAGLLSAILAAPATAATITDGGPWFDTHYSLDVSNFTRTDGPCGDGGSVINDGCSVVRKDSSSPVPYGRFGFGGGSWIDSQDIMHLDMALDFGRTVRGFTLLLSDAHDQPNSFFSASMDGALWQIANREPNGIGHYLSFAFSEPTDHALVSFSTQHNDGFGVAPVPLPQTAMLLLTGVLGLALVARRRAAKVMAS